MLLMLLYALGWYTPAFRGMYEILPGVNLYRRPADAVFLIGALGCDPRRLCDASGVPRALGAAIAARSRSRLPVYSHWPSSQRSDLA